MVARLTIQWVWVHSTHAYAQNVIGNACGTSSFVWCLYSRTSDCKRTQLAVNIVNYTFVLFTCLDKSSKPKEEQREKRNQTEEKIWIKKNWKRNEFNAFQSWVNQKMRELQKVKWWNKNRGIELVDSEWNVWEKRNFDVIIMKNKHNNGEEAKS